MAVDYNKSSLVKINRNVDLTLYIQGSININRFGKCFCPSLHFYLSEL